jgi:hypothetical protein
MESTNIADNVSGWTGLGVKLPDELNKAIELFESVRYAEVGRQPVFDVESLTQENAEDKIREFAEQLALSEVPGGGLSVLDRAKKQVVESAARQVISLARHAIPDVIDQLTPTFDKHVEAYIEAVGKLPETLTANALVAAGADAVTAFADAQREAGFLHRIDAWVVQTGYVTGVLSKQMEVTCRILRPNSVIQLTKLDAAHHTQADQTLTAVDPVFYTAARLGVEFGIQTLREAAKLRSALQSVSAQKLSGVATIR